MPVIAQDYWEVVGAPAQVIINSMSDVSVPSISANVTITNEGTSGYEYKYEYCVVADENNQCGGGDDVAFASAAKFIQAGESWTTNLNLTVANIGNYWFKTVVWWGTEASGASRTFTATTEEAAPLPGGGGFVAVPSVSLDTIYNKLLEVQNELGFHDKTRTAYQDMLLVKNWLGALPDQLSQPMYKELTDTSIQLNKTVTLLGEKIDPLSSGFKSLLEVSQANVSDLKEIKNKLADLRAISSVTRRSVEQIITEPIVEAWMTFHSVQFNFLISNPLAETKTLNFKSYLPAEVKPEHILDLGGLSIDYDPNAATYYVHSNITLGPGQSVTEKVEIKDIWVFSEEEIESLKKQAETLTGPLVKTQYEAQGAILKNQNESVLNIILLNQKENYRTPQDHIVNYRTDVEKMAEVKKNLEKMKDLVVQVGASQGMVGKVGGIQTFATWGIILAIVFGLGLLAAVIFAMWRQQTMLITAAMGISREEAMAQLGETRRKKKTTERGVLKSVATGAGEISQKARSRAPAVQLVIRRLPWKKILVWVVVISVLVILGIVAIKFAPGLFGKQEIKLNLTPTMPQEKPAERAVIPETQDNAEIFFSNEDEKKETAAIEEVANLPNQSSQSSDGTGQVKLTILDTAGRLNVRDKASPDGKIITKVFSNEQYEYTDEKNGWYFITIPKGKNGWVFGEYVQKIEN